MKEFAVSIVWIKKVGQEDNPNVPGIQIMNTLLVLQAETRSESIRLGILNDPDLYREGYEVYSTAAVEIGIEIRHKILGIHPN